MHRTRQPWKRGFTNLAGGLVLLAVALSASGCALHTREALAIRMLEEQAESTPVVPDVYPPH